MIELVRFQSANYSNYYFRYAIDDDTVGVIKCATNSISVDGDNIKSSRCSLVTPTVYNYVSGIVFTAITNKQYDLYAQVSTDQETWTNFGQTNLTFYNNGTEYIGCASSSELFNSDVPLTGGWGSSIENGITIVSTHENIIQNNTVLTDQQWCTLIASDPKEYLWKVQSPDGKIYHIRDAEAKEILDNLETFEVDVDSHVLHINGDSAAGGGSTHTYSTTEQVVGTWIDGKEVYELTIALSSSVNISTGSWSQFTDIITTDWFLVIEAVGLRTNSGVYVPVYASHNANTNLELRGISSTFDIDYIIVKYVKSAST